MSDTLQDRANAAAKAAGVDPLAATIEGVVEWAPKSPDGTIWWVYSTTDRSQIELGKGWTLAYREIEIKKSEWKDA